MNGILLGFWIGLGLMLGIWFGIMFAKINIIIELLERM